MQYNCRSDSGLEHSNVVAKSTVFFRLLSGIVALPMYLHAGQGTVQKAPLRCRHWCLFTSCFVLDKGVP